MSSRTPAGWPAGALGRGAESLRCWFNGKSHQGQIGLFALEAPQHRHLIGVPRPVGPRSEWSRSEASRRPATPLCERHAFLLGAEPWLSASLGAERAR